MIPSIQPLPTNTSFTSWDLLLVFDWILKKYQPITLILCLLLKFFLLLRKIFLLVCFLFISYLFFCSTCCFLPYSSRVFILDVIGHVVKRETLNDFERHGQTTRLLQFVLEDLRFTSSLSFICIFVCLCSFGLLVSFLYCFLFCSMDKIQCTIWAQFAEEMHANLEQHSSSAPPVVVVVQLCKLKKFLGIYVIICHLLFFALILLTITTLTYYKKFRCGRHF